MAANSRKISRFAGGVLAKYRPRTDAISSRRADPLSRFAIIASLHCYSVTITVRQRPPFGNKSVEAMRRKK
jgi:hypothetical protein